MKKIEGDSSREVRGRDARETCTRITGSVEIVADRFLAIFSLRVPIQSHGSPLHPQDSSDRRIKNDARSFGFCSVERGLISRPNVRDNRLVLGLREGRLSFATSGSDERSPL